MGGRRPDKWLISGKMEPPTVTCRQTNIEFHEWALVSPTTAPNRREIEHGVPILSLLPHAFLDLMGYGLFLPPVKFLAQLLRCGSQRLIDLVPLLRRSGRCQPFVYHVERGTREQKQASQVSAVNINDM